MSDILTYHSVDGYGVPESKPFESGGISDNLVLLYESPSTPNLREITNIDISNYKYLVIESTFVSEKLQPFIIPVTTTDGYSCIIGYSYVNNNVSFISQNITISSEYNRITFNSGRVISFSSTGTVSSTSTNYVYFKRIYGIK